MRNVDLNSFINKFFFVTCKRPSLFLLKHKELTLILFMGFILRYFLLDWNSYWLDELFSVYEWGIKFDSTNNLIGHFREIAYPVPLYELILFNWMNLFGHSEVATRLLSTIFVTLSTLFLYLFTLRIFSRRIAVATILFFSLSYMAVYYSLEARYYGLILFLSIFSSYMMVLYLESLNRNYSWKNIFLNWFFVAMVIANAALILTHLHTFLFISSQGIFILLYFIFSNNLKNILLNMVKVAALYLVQIIIVFALWGRVIVDFTIQIIDNTFPGATSYSLFLKQPHIVFYQYVLEPNLSLPYITFDRLAHLTYLLDNYSFLIYVVIVLFFVIIAVKYTGIFKGRHIEYSFFKNKIFIYYIILWLLATPVFAWFIYSFGHFDRFFDRYIIFCTPPLMILTVITLERGLSLLDWLVRRLLKKSFIRHYLRYATVYAFIAAILLVLPGGFQGATERKADWRGIANHIVEHVHRDPYHSYIIFETTYHPDYILLDYYFARYSDHVRVYDTIKQTVERDLLHVKNYRPWFTESSAEKEISRYDYLIVSFHDLPSTRFPLTIKMLSEKYDLTGRFLDDQGRGYLIFKIKPE